MNTRHSYVQSDEVARAPYISIEPRQQDAQKYFIFIIPVQENYIITEFKSILGPTVDRTLLQISREVWHVAISDKIEHSTIRYHHLPFQY